LFYPMALTVSVPSRNALPQGVPAEVMGVLRRSATSPGDSLGTPSGVDVHTFRCWVSSLGTAWGEFAGIALMQLVRGLHRLVDKVFRAPPGVSVSRVSPGHRPRSGRIPGSETRKAAVCIQTAAFRRERG